MMKSFSQVNNKKSVSQANKSAHRESERKVKAKPRVKVSEVRKATTLTSKAALKSVVKHTSKKNPSPYAKRLKRNTKKAIKAMLLSSVFSEGVKVVVAIGIVSSVLYSSYHYISKTFANEVIISQSEIITRVSKLTSLPKDEPYEIVRVQDEEDLRKQNPFYKDIKEGDYILIYKNLAVIYDLRNNVVLATKRTDQ